ncbi:hypothetical protein PZB74_05340 [Porifericola rhodea]|uniref:hypothetical protein n=1 Tax=Porifericola rhodea TaxID=930972 RepID=UPI0026658FD5|nr:hypothetical protein [Porifericola rhodea]WKN32768.1 hypothetical protein PZB74_05340 [Porifericola rhodea]
MRRVVDENIGMLLLFLAAMTGLYACTGSSAKSPVEAASHFNAQWAMDARWEQGTAEVAKYDAQRVVYGKARDFEYVFILVKETFNEKYKVKTDDYDRKDLFDVMKVNKFCRIPTDNYPYHYLTSIFYKREQPSTVYKLTNTSQEWCGNTSKYFLEEGRKYKFGYNSYWDGQGIGEMMIDGNIMFEDQLSHALRALDFQEGLQFKQAVAESQVNSKATKPKIYQANFAVSKDAAFSLDTKYDLSQVDEVWKVEVQLDDDKTNTYWFGSNYPNILLKQESWDGRRLQLKETYMDAYWNS